MPAPAEFARLAGNGRVHRHPLAVVRSAHDHTGELVPEHERLLQFCIANTGFAKPVQIRTANAHPPDAEEHHARMDFRPGVLSQADIFCPRMQGGEVAYPFLLAGQIIHFQGEPDRKLGKVRLDLAHLPDIKIQLIEPHPPIVKIILRHGRMIGKADFCEADGHGVARIIHRFADCGACVRVAAHRHRFNWSNRLSSSSCF